MNRQTIKFEGLYIITAKDEELTPTQPEQSSFNIRRVLLHVIPKIKTIHLYKGKTASQKSLSKARTIAREINAKHGFTYQIKQHMFNSSQEGWETYQKHETTLKSESEVEPEQESFSVSETMSQKLMETSSLVKNHPLPQSLAIMLASILQESLPDPFPQDPEQIKAVLHGLVDKLVEQNPNKN